MKSTETAAVSKSFLSDLRYYVLSRLLAARPLAALSLLLGLGWLAGHVETGSQAAWLLFLTTTMFFAFRLWDDLKDIDHDRSHHAHRILCRTRFVPQFQTLCRVLLATSCLALVAAWQLTAVTAYAVTVIALWFWYDFRDRFHRTGAWYYHILLLKYPGIVIAVATSISGQWSGTILKYAVVAYLLVCVAEVLHDVRLQARFVNRVLAISEAFVLSMLVVDLAR